MKKFLVSLMLLTYCTVSTGFIISRHFCMDQFDSAQIGTSGDDRCDKCGMHKDGGCCRDDVKVVKLETSHLLSQVSFPAFEMDPVVVTTPDFISHSLQNFTITAPSIAHGPPVVERQLYIQLCVFRI